MSKLTNRFNADEAIVAAVANDSYDYADAGDVSITGLSVPPQIRILRKRHFTKLVEDVSDRLASLRGQVAHAIVERSGLKNDWSERRVGMMVNGWKVTGKPDKLEAIRLAANTLVDFKFPTMSSFQFGFQRDKGLKEEYKPQGNGYKLLLSEQGVDVERITFKPTLLEWSKFHATTKKDYPPSPFFSFDIPIWSLKESLAWVTDRVKLHQYAETLPDDKLPECTHEERWQRGDVFAVKKEGLKNAVRGGLKDSEVEANALVKELGDKHYVERRPAMAIRCEFYCSVKPFCHQYKKTIPKGVEISGIHSGGY